MLTYSRNLQYGTQITLMASYWHKSSRWRFSKYTAWEVWEDTVCACGWGEGERGKGRTDGRTDRRWKTSSCRVTAVNEDSCWAEALIASKITAFMIKQQARSTLIGWQAWNKVWPKIACQKRHQATNKQGFQVESAGLNSHRQELCLPAVGRCLYFIIHAWPSGVILI